MLARDLNFEPSRSAEGGAKLNRKTNMYGLRVLALARRVPIMLAPIANGFVAWHRFVVVARVDPFLRMALNPEADL
jgi:hypothetical protein